MVNIALGYISISLDFVYLWNWVSIQFSYEPFFICVVRGVRYLCGTLMDG